MATRFPKWVVLGSVALMLLSLSQTWAAEKTTISFYVFGDLAEKAAYESLVSAFNQHYPDIAVNLVYTPGEDELNLNGSDEYRSRLSLDFASAKPPDVFLMNYREYRIFA